MIQLTIIFVYLCSLLVLGIFSSRLFRGTSKDYMLASHSIGPFLLLMSLFGTTMTAFALVGSSGEAFKEGVGVYGLLASSSGIIHSFCFFVIGIKLWSLGRRHGYTTQIQYFRDRLESDGIGLLLFPILVGLVIPYLLIGVMASGTVINSVTGGAFSTMFAEADYGVPKWIGSLVICVVVLLYVFFGGMRGTAWANAFQTIVFMILGLVTFIIISDKLGGLREASSAVAEKNPSKLKRTVDPKDIESYEKKWIVWLQMATDAFKQKENVTTDLSVTQHNIALLSMDDRVFSDPLPEAWQNKKIESYHDLQEFQRTDGWEDKALAQFAAKIGHPDDLLDPDNAEAGKKWTRLKALGIYRAGKWAPEQPHGMHWLQFLTYLLVPLSVGMFPHLFQHWLTAKSAGSFKLPVVAHPVFIMIVWVPCVLVGIWATSAVVPGTLRPLVPPHFPANAVLAYLVKTLTGPYLTGFLTAGILAAIMSSLDSQFLCIGTMFTNDIVVHYGGKNRFSDKQTLLMARCFIIAVVAITYGFSLVEPRRVFTLGVWCFSGFSSLFPLVFAAVYWRGLTRAGAYACVVTAAGMWLYLFQLSGYGMKPNFTIAHMMPVAVLFAASTAAMVLVSLVTKPPSQETLKKFF